MVIPSDTMVMQSDPRSVALTLSFSHPMEMIGMDMQKPEVFQVVSPTGNLYLVTGLKQMQIMNRAAWGMDYRISRPGVYVFHMQPQPYWEPAEGSAWVEYCSGDRYPVLMLSLDTPHGPLLGRCFFRTNGDNYYLLSCYTRYLDGGDAEGVEAMFQVPGEE